MGLFEAALLEYDTASHTYAGVSTDAATRGRICTDTPARAANRASVTIQEIIGHDVPRWKAQVASWVEWETRIEITDKRATKRVYRKP